MRSVYIYIIVFCGIVSIPAVSLAQNKKDLRKYGVKSVTEIVTKTEEVKEITFKDSYQRFDKNGNAIEEINYRKDGTTKERIIRKFDEGNNLVQEEIFDGSGKLIQKLINTYNIDEEKTSETEFDGNGQEVKKTLILYNNKGLKTEKKVYDKSGKLVMLKKYHYTN